MSVPLTILLVDDEPLALDRLERICRRLDGVSVVGLAASGTEALERAASLAPDVVLLDITMPDMDGIETGRRLRAARNPPAIIFTTAHEEFAIDAFGVEAVHYLLKPVLRGQLEDALSRVRLRQPARQDSPPSLGEIWVSRGYELFRLALASVDYIEAEGDYMRFHVGGQSYLHYMTIKRLAADLDPTHFLRVHRSYIVARDRVTGLAARRQGGWALTLAGGQVIPVSAPYLEAVRKLATRYA